MTTDTRPGALTMQMLIGGDSVPAADGQTFEVIQQVLRPIMKALRQIQRSDQNTLLR